MPIAETSQAAARADPKLSLPVFTKRPYPHAHQAIVGAIMLYFSILQPHPPSIKLRTRPDAAIATGAKRENQVLRNIRGSVRNHPLILQMVQSPAPGANPDAPIAIFQHGHGIVVRQSLLLRIGHKPFRRQADQALLRTNPQVPFPVFKKRIDVVEGRSFIVELIQEPTVPEAVQSTVSAHPQISFAVFADCADERVRQTVMRAVGVKSVLPEPIVPEQAIV